MFFAKRTSLKTEEIDIELKSFAIDMGKSCSQDYTSGLDHTNGSLKESDIQELLQRLKKTTRENIIHVYSVFLHGHRYRHPKKLSATPPNKAYDDLLVQVAIMAEPSLLIDDSLKEYFLLTHPYFSLSPGVVERRYYAKFADLPCKHLPALLSCYIAALEKEENDTLSKERVIRLPIFHYLVAFCKAKAGEQYKLILRELNSFIEKERTPPTIKAP